MKILSSGEIQSALKKCMPRKIAVAFIGMDWDKYLENTDHIEHIIVSPTLGSNPFAIQKLVNSIGWNKVFFLSSLHAKVYLGESHAIVGSANLTKNGMSGDRLSEVAVEIVETKEINVLNSIVDDYLDRAKIEFPYTFSKKEKLKQLFDIWNNAVSNNVVEADFSDGNSFDEFELLSDDQFYVTWYQTAHVEFSEEVKSLESVIVGSIPFLESDEIDVNKWVLLWKITNDSKPHKTVKPYWLYVHDIFSCGVIDEDNGYTKLAVERNDRELPPEPFELDDEIVAIFKSSIVASELSEYFIQNEMEYFSVNHSRHGLPKLIDRMKQSISKLGSVSTDLK